MLLYTIIEPNAVMKFLKVLQMYNTKIVIRVDVLTNWPSSGL